MIQPTIFYRYRDLKVSLGADQFDNSRGYRIQLLVEEYYVTRTTPKGVWIFPKFGGAERFIKTNARKRFACSTKEEALESFISRKIRQIKILRQQLRDAESALAEAQCEEI